MPDYLTTDEAAQKLRVAPCTVTRLIRSGQLPALRAGRRWLIDPQQLDRWLVDRTAKLTGPSRQSGSGWTGNDFGGSNDNYSG